jgi:large subunit ribosomal protein L25
MKTVSLSGSPRENVGKKDTKALRRQGLVPCVIYGGEKQIHFSVKLIELGKLIYTPDVYKIEIDVDGKKYLTIAKEYQFHAVSDKVIHADFIELSDKREVKVDLPVRLTGNSIGVRNGGRLLVIYRTLSLKGLPSAFPETIDIDITNLRIGKKIRVSEVKLPGLTILEPANAVICGIKRSRISVEEEEEAEAEAAEAAEALAEGEDATSGEGAES